jgi:SAM-dependent methyltransferase
MDHSALTRKTYNAVAQQYHDKFSQISIYDASYKQFAELLTANARVLEIGCGPGNVCQKIMAMQPQIDWLGIDLAEKMVEIAQQVNPTAHFQTGDARQLSGFEPGFNGILGGFCVPYLNSKETIALLKDAWQLLAPAGVLYLSSVIGEYTQSRMVSNSQGDQSVFLHYYPADFIPSRAAALGFCTLYNENIRYENGEYHQLWIGKKHQPK